MWLKIRRNSFGLFCFLVNILHIYYLCDEYFRFEVTTKVQITIPDEIQVPAFTICYRLYDVIKWEDLSSDQRKKLFEGLTSEDFKSPVDLSPSNIRSLQVSRSISDQISNNLYYMFNTSSIFNHTRDVWEVINKAEINPLIKKRMALDSLGDHRPLKQTLTFFMGNCKCFTLEVKKELGIVVNYQKLVLATSGMPWINTFTLNSHQLVVFLYIHSSDHVTTRLHSFKYIEPYYYLIASLQTYTTILLPFPYSSKCKDYSIIGATSKAHCKEMCMQAMIADKYKVLDAEFYAYVTDLYPIRQNTLRNETEKEGIVDHCERRCCQKDCSSTLFNSDTVVYYRKNESIVVTVADKSPSTRTEAQAAIPFVVFMTNVLSTLGIWLGVSLLGSGSEIKRIAKCVQIRNNYQFIRCRFNQAVTPCTTDLNDSRTNSTFFLRKLPDRH